MLAFSKLFLIWHPNCVSNVLQTQTKVSTKTFNNNCYAGRNKMKISFYTRNKHLKINIIFYLLFFIFPTSAINAQPIPQTSWSLWYVDSEEIVKVFKPATNAFDGDTATIWHTEWYENNPSPPHEIQINLGGLFEIDGFRYLPRQDDGENGRIGQYEFYVSENGVDWNSPVATGAFTNDSTEKEILFQIVEAQFIRLRALTEVNGNPWTAVAEISILGNPLTGNMPPNGVIDTPTENITINTGDSLFFSGTGNDPDGNQDLTFLWNFGTNSGLPDSAEDAPGSIRFDIPGIFTITYTVTDSLGLPDPTPDTITVTVINDAGSIPIPQTSWSLWYVDSEEIVKVFKPATNAFDGDPATIWHTEWYENNPSPPHEIQINLGGLFEIDGFRYLPRQDDGENGRIGQYEFYVSENGVDWNSPVATGAFTNDSTEKEILFQPIETRFIRLLSLTEVNDNPWTAVAEINMLGQCIAPSIHILQPIDLHLQTSSNISVIPNVCLDEDLHFNWGAKFLLDGGIENGGAEMESFTPPFNVTFSNVNKSEHTIEVIIIDETGAEINGAETSHQVTNIAVGDYYVAFGDSITEGSNDNIYSDDTSQDLRNTGGGYSPILNNLLTAAQSYPHNVANEGVAGDDSSEGLARIPSVLEAHSDSHYFLIMFGANDSHGSLPVPSGLDENGSLLAPGNPGYAGSFLDNMQQIVDAVSSAGKIPVLAKVPIALGWCSTCEPFINPDTAPRNLLIQEYNVVINALASDIGSEIIPPDFYEYFRTHEYEFSDNLHPNGQGYQSMANLWYEAIISQ